MLLRLGTGCVCYCVVVVDCCYLHTNMLYCVFVSYVVVFVCLLSIVVDVLVLVLRVSSRFLCCRLLGACLHVFLCLNACVRA